MQTQINLTVHQRRILRDFLDIAEANDFASITTAIENPACGVWLSDGRNVDALAAAYDDVLDAWTVLDYSGRVSQYLSGEVY